MNGSNFSTHYKTYLAKITPDGNLDWMQPLYNTLDSLQLKFGNDGSVLVAFGMSKSISQLGMSAPCSSSIGVVRFLLGRESGMERSDWRDFRMFELRVSHGRLRTGRMAEPSYPCIQTAGVGIR